MRSAILALFNLILFSGSMEFSNFIEFWRIIYFNQRQAINISKIQAVNGQYLMIDDQKIPISRKHKSELMDMLEQI